MTTHPHRGRVVLRPLKGGGAHSDYTARNLASRMPPGWTALAMHETDGLLARTAVGRLAIWQGDRLVSIDERKAQAALDGLTS